MAKKRKTSPLWADDANTKSPLTTNVAAPAERRRAKNVKLQTGIIYGTIGLFIVSGLLSLAVLTDPSKDVVTKPPTSLSINSSLGKGAASTEMANWLNADPAPLPGAVLVSWDGYDPIEPGKSTASQRGADRGELHHFTLASPSKNGTVYYAATVLVSVDEALGAVVVGTPSVLPQPPAATNGWSSEVWAGYASAQTTESVTDAVKAWSQAFTDTPAALRLAVGDGDSNHSYIPLTGARVTEVSVTDVGAVKTDDGTDPETLLVRVSLSVTWSTGEKAEASPSVLTYDLLVHDATTAAPRVVAWGGAGTGPDLTKYVNAVTGLDVKEQLPEAPEESGSPEEAQPTDPEATPPATEPTPTSTPTKKSK